MATAECVVLDYLAAKCSDVVAAVLLRLFDCILAETPMPNIRMLMRARLMGLHILTGD